MTSGISRALTAWQATRGPRSLWLLSDGSKLQDRRAGAGWALYCAGHQLATGHIPLGTHCEVFDAETEALRQGLRTATRHPLASAMDSLWACLDNQGVVQAVHGSRASSSLSAIQESQQLLTAWESRPRQYTALTPGVAGVI